MDEEGNTVVRFPDREEITVEYADIASLAFRLTLLEPMGHSSSFGLSCFDMPSRFVITDYFHPDQHADEGKISKTGRNVEAMVPSHVLGYEIM